jgi:hypothetical protein
MRQHWGLWAGHDGLALGWQNATSRDAHRDLARPRSHGGMDAAGPPDPVTRAAGRRSILQAFLQRNAQLFGVDPRELDRTLRATGFQ